MTRGKGCAALRKLAASYSSDALEAQPFAAVVHATLELEERVNALEAAWNGLIDDGAAELTEESAGHADGLEAPAEPTPA